MTYLQRQELERHRDKRKSQASLAEKGEENCGPLVLAWGWGWTAVKQWECGLQEQAQFLLCLEKQWTHLGHGPGMEG